MVNYTEYGQTLDSIRKLSGLILSGLILSGLILSGLILYVAPNGP